MDRTEFFVKQKAMNCPSLFVLFHLDDSASILLRVSSVGLKSLWGKSGNSPHHPRFLCYSPTPGTIINVVQYVNAAKKMVKYAPKM